MGSVYPGLVKTASYYNNIKALEKIGGDTERVMKFTAHMEEKGMFLQPEESATFLKYLLTETSNEEFVNTNWRADDEKHWVKWRK